MRRKPGWKTPDTERHLTPEIVASLGRKRLAEFVLEATAEHADLFDKIVSAIKTQDAQAPASGTDEADHMVGASNVMLEVFSAIRKVAAVDAPVLITGESGTGKELAAQAIHERSARSSGPFIPINCAGLPPTLIASELFGHEKGSFTGADARRIGRINAANGGTLFLDEIGDIPLELQSHLLRFLQEQTIDRIGANEPIRVDVRIIAATNSDLETAVDNGRFREDLFYRLNVLTVNIPPLRERGEDIELLSTYFLHKFSQEIGRPECKFDDHAIEALCNFLWPGNVRELISCIRRAVVMAEGEYITIADLGMPVIRRRGLDGGEGGTLGQEFDAQVASYFSADMSLAAAKSQLERDIIRKALQSHDRNIKRTAEHLGVSRVTLYRLMAKHDIHPD